MKQKFLGICGLLIVCASVLTAQPVWADPPANNNTSANNCRGDFLGLKPWHSGLCQNGEVVPICEKGAECPQGSVKLQDFVWRVVLNITFDITVMIGYIAAAMVIYGGYLYIMAQGDAARVMRGKKTLTSAVIGTVIALGASVIVNTIIQILGLNTGAGLQQNFNQQTLDNIFSWAYAMAGVVAVAFVIKSGIEYMTSTGDTNKTSKATHSLIYSAVGLVIVIFAAIITKFIITSVGGAL